MANIIIFKNLNSGSLQFDNISVPGGILASSASVTASDYNQEFEIQSDEQIKDYIQSGYLVVSDGGSFYDSSGSLNYVTSFLSKFTLDNDNLVDGQVLYISGNSIKGTSSGSFLDTGANIGSGQGVFANKSGTTLNFRSLTASGSVSLVSGSGITGAFNTGSGVGTFFGQQNLGFVFKSISGSGNITVTDNNSGTIILSSSQQNPVVLANTGSGQGVYQQQIGNNYYFRSLLGTGSVAIVSGTNDITVSGTVYVDYAGPGPSTNRAIPVFSGTTGKFIQNSSASIDVSGNIDNNQGTYNGIRFYNKSASDPVSPTPADGDRYYNTAMRLEMVYDGARSKWLSNESFIFQWGRNGNTAMGSFFNGENTIQFTNAKGYVPAFSGTVVALGYSRQDNDAAVFEITVTGSQIAFISSSAQSGTSNSINSNFPANFVIGARNQDNLNAVTDVQGWARLRWRV